MGLWFALGPDKHRTAVGVLEIKKLSEDLISFSKKRIYTPR
jgi:hypothetical protein